MRVSTEILVIGGGATGLGVARDAALRGFKTILVEKGDLAHGTSGRYHGLLHSGARYVVRDPRSAEECYRENLILKRLLPSAIEDTGGYFAALPEDPPEYVQPFLDGCRAAGIPAEEIPPALALKEEPLLNPKLARVFRVPDAACDSFDASHALAESIRTAGGEVWTRHKVVGLLREGTRVVGAELENIATAERFALGADLVINCSGAWAGIVAALAGCEVKVTPGKGTMIAMNSRLVNTVVNRLKPPSDGDILVPVGTVAVMGTTEVVVDNPDQYAIDDDEIELLLAEGEKLIPRFRGFRVLRAWAGVRPLFQDRPSPPGPLSRSERFAQRTGEGESQASRLMSRAHSVLDHAARDGVEGFISVVGGKFTTFRLMAEETVNLAGRKLGTERKCLTAETPIDSPGKKFHTLGQRLGEIESGGKGEIVCECELVTRAQVEAALRQSGSLVLNDLRRDLRLGMGPCQAGFCAYRAAGILHGLTPLPAGASPDEKRRERGEGPGMGDEVRAINSALIEFLQERWKGLRPVMWGANLRQLELDLNIYRNLLGADRLPTARDPEVYPTENTA
ncbi:MAG: FAD dependent oxidoreductase family protein [Anaerolineales bacterium]|nr:FAD dependent oxidoreductase family protein [Anaerolineales bacterium]